VDVERVIQEQMWTSWVTAGSANGFVVDRSSVDVWATFSNGSASSSSVTLNIDDSTSGPLFPLFQATSDNTPPFWQDWAANPQHMSHGRRVPMDPPFPSFSETEEEKAQRIIRRQQERERWEIERLQRDVELKASQIQAAALLDSLLDEVQQASLQEEDWFLVMGSSGNVYRLRRGRIGNIDLVSPEGKILKTFCVHPGIHLPNADDLIAQKLHLETDEESLLKIANPHHVYHGQAPVIDIRKHLKAA